MITVELASTGNTSARRGGGRAGGGTSKHSLLACPCSQTPLCSACGGPSTPARAQTHCRAVPSSNQHLGLFSPGLCGKAGGKKGTHAPLLCCRAESQPGSSVCSCPPCSTRFGRRSLAPAPPGWPRLKGCSWYAWRWGVLQKVSLSPPHKPPHLQESLSSSSKGSLTLVGTAHPSPGLALKRRWGRLWTHWIREIPTSAPVSICSRGQ